MATIAVIGGTGQQGFGLAVRWYLAGHRVLIGSRDPERARQAAARVREAAEQVRQAAGRVLKAEAQRREGAAWVVEQARVRPTAADMRQARAGVSGEGPAAVAGEANREAARLADVVVLTVPFHAQAALLEELRDAVQGRVVVDTTVPLRRFRPPELEEVAEGSSAQRVQALLPGARVVAAFQTVSAVKLADLEQPLQEDTLICGDDPAAREVVATLAEAIGLRGVDAGPLAQARTLERLACLIIGLNQRYHRRAIGIRFQGL